MTIKPTKLAFERRYTDDSGIEYAVRLDHHEIEIESHDEFVRVPAAEIHWLLATLERIRDEVCDQDPEAQP